MRGFDWSWGVRKILCVWDRLKRSLCECSARDIRGHLGLWLLSSVEECLLFLRVKRRIERSLLSILRNLILLRCLTGWHLLPWWDRILVKFILNHWRPFFHEGGLSLHIALVYAILRTRKFVQLCGIALTGSHRRVSVPLNLRMLLLCEKFDLLYWNICLII